MTKESVIEEFTALKGIGSSKAELLYKNGFDSIDKLKNSSVKELTNIKGITEKNAKDIIYQLKDKDSKKPILEKTESKSVKKEPAKSDETAKVEKIAETKDEEVKIVEAADEEVYKVKKKPKLSDAQKKKLKIRRKIKKRTPNFLREEWFRYKRIPKNWRRPDGITSKMRINLKYRPSKVRVGFRGPREVRGLHSSGFEEVIIFNVSDLEKINPEKQAVRIGSTVGTKKRLDISKRAEELEIRILNMRM